MRTLDASAVQLGAPGPALLSNWSRFILVGEGRAWARRLSTGLTRRWFDPLSRVRPHPTALNFAVGDFAIVDFGAEGTFVYACWREHESHGARRAR